MTSSLKWFVVICRVFLFLNTASLSLLPLSLISVPSFSPSPFSLILTLSSPLLLSLESAHSSSHFFLPETERALHPPSVPPADQRDRFPGAVREPSLHFRSVWNSLCVS